MYLNHIRVQGFRTFRDTSASFVHPDADFDALRLPRPMLPNVNLLLGNNGLGKTTLLKAVSLAALGPAVGDAGLFPYRLVREEPEGGSRSSPDKAVIEARFSPNPQDGLPAGIPYLESEVSVVRRGDLESLRWTHSDDKSWHPIFSVESDAFFFVGYGATRRVEKHDQVDLGARRSSSFARAQRIQSLFEEAYSLIPLSAWLPELETQNPGRHKQVVNLVDRLLGHGQFRFKGEHEKGEYLFEQHGLKVPFRALSDGYRAYLGWVGDLLYHVCMTCPSGKKLVDNRGIVMVDEIDLHLHPQWQMRVVPTLAKALPHIQFILTSHSPLIVGSLEWMNLLVMRPEPQQASAIVRVPERIHGLDADQLLLTDLFGLESTRAGNKTDRLKSLTLAARGGDDAAALELLKEMGTGMEPGP